MAVSSADQTESTFIQMPEGPLKERSVTPFGVKTKLRLDRWYFLLRRIDRRLEL
jgi:hypothetical protein